MASAVSGNSSPVSLMRVVRPSVNLRSKARSASAVVMGMAQRAKNTGRAFTHACRMAKATNGGREESSGITEDWTSHTVVTASFTAMGCPMGTPSTCSGSCSASPLPTHRRHLLGFTRRPMTARRLVMKALAASTSSHTSKCAVVEVAKHSNIRVSLRHRGEHRVDDHREQERTQRVSLPDSCAARPNISAVVSIHVGSCPVGPPHISSQSRYQTLHQRLKHLNACHVDGIDDTVIAVLGECCKQGRGVHHTYSAPQGPDACPPHLPPHKPVHHASNRADEPRGGRGIRHQLLNYLEGLPTKARGGLTWKAG